MPKKAASEELSPVDPFLVALNLFQPKQESGWIGVPPGSELKILGGFPTGRWRFLGQEYFFLLPVKSSK